VKGFVNDNGEISWDICSTPSIEGYEGAADYIFEKFCDDDGHVHGEQSKCPNGCQDGACLKESGTKCTDSDGGKDYSVKGSVSFGGTEHEDSCMFNQDKFLVEAYCENNFQKLETVECKDRCENGKCVSGNIASGNCKDSEDGIDIYNKGYVLSSGSKLYDYCDDNSIVDYICMGNTPREDRTVCPYGCNDGVCITSKNPSQSCSDSDEGQNYFTKGKVIWAGNEIYDYCSTRSGNTVYEQYCYNNELKYERYECPNKCSDGRCIDKTEDEYKGFLSLAVNSKEIELVANQRQNKIVLKYYGGDSNNPSVCGLEVNGENVEFMEEQTKTVEGVRISLIDIVPGSKSSYPRCEVNIKAMACIDSDGSKNYFEKGFVDFEGEIVYDYCNDGSENQLIESYCTDNDKVDTISYDCPDRCENGVCIHETEEVTLPKGFVDNVGDNCNNNEDCSSHNCVNNICRPYCEGCMMDESCIPYGTRHESNYCDITKIINSQKGEYESCSNNYECTTNLCVDNQCVSSNLIQKIIQWFKKLFGG
jgi:hypothetical protein